MKYSLPIFLLAFFALAATQDAGAQCNAPIINSFAPTTGFIGSTVTITGANFSTTPSDNIVYFGAVKATVLTASFSQITVEVPVGLNTQLISVRNNCNKVAYTKTHFNPIFCETPLNSTTYNGTQFDLAVAAGAYNMILADWDNDGKPEPTTGNAGTGLSIARNNSTPGTFNFTAINLTMPGSIRYLAAADFDGDGKLDLVTSGNRTYVYRNTSSGPGNYSFAAGVIAGNDGVYQCGVGDFNGDGKIDIVSGGSGNNVFFYRNTSTGPGNISFAAAGSLNTPGGSGIRGIMVADADCDGKADVYFSSYNSNQLITIRNTTAVNAGTFTWEAPEVWSTGGNRPYRCAIADFDKDGRIDFTACNFSGGSTAILRNTSTVGDISFATAYTIPAPNSNYRIGVGDANGDGLPDIITKSSGSNTWSLYPNNSSGPGNISFTGRIDYSSSAQAEISGILIGDMDGDFVPDVATSGTSSSRIRFHRNQSIVPDVTPPTALCQDITVGIDQSGMVTVTGEDIDNGSSDACGIDDLEINGMASIDFDCTDLGDNVVTLTVTDLSGNTATCTATVTVNPAAITVNGQATVCAGETVELESTSADTYQWKKDGVNIPGATMQTYTVTTTGTYSVEVTNAAGCDGESDPVLITVNANPTVTTDPTGNASLCPPMNNLTITASMNALYQWKKDGVDIPGATMQSYTATMAGTYVVEVIDLFGCSATSADVIVAATDNIDPEITCPANPAAVCDGQATTWDPPVATDNCGVDNVMGSHTSGDVFPVGTTAVTFTAEDAAGNTGTCSFEVAVNANPACSITANQSITCGGSTTNTYSAPAGMASYSWTIMGDGTITSADDIETITVEADASGSYTVEVTIENGDGCSSTCDLVVNITTVELQVTTTAPAMATCGDVIDIEVQVSDEFEDISSLQFGLDWDETQLQYLSHTALEIGGAGGDPVIGTVNAANGEMSFSWADPAGADGEDLADNTVIMTISMKVLASSGSATVSGSDAVLQSEVVDKNFCVNTATYANDAVIALQGIPISCPPNATVCLSDDPVILTGATPSGGVYSGNGVSGGVFFPQSAGLGMHTITYEYTDGNGCPATCMFTITVTGVPATFTATIQECNEAAMGNPTATFDLSDADEEVTTGDPMGMIPAGLTITYHNSPADAHNDANPIMGPYVSETKDIWVRVEDANGCYGINIVQLVVNENPGIVLDVTDETCNESNDGAISASVTSGPPPYTYAWNTGATTSSISGLTAGTYTVSVTDANGCQSTAEGTVAQPAALDVEITKVDVVCAGTATGSATATASDGTAPYIYYWSNGDSGPVADELAAGTYTVTVYDANNCSTTESVMITEPATAISVAVTVDAQPSCGSNNGELTATVSNGTANYDYEWSNGDETLNSASNTNTVDMLTGGTYFVTVTDSDGCTAVAQGNLESTDGPTATITAQTDVTCFGGANGEATVTVTGGTSPFDYAWSGGTPGTQNTNNSNSTSNTQDGFAAGTYVVTVTDDNGCTSLASVNIQEPPRYSAAIIATTDVSCTGGSDGTATALGLGGTPGYTYEWSNGDMTAQATGLSANTTYTVTVTDNNMCETTTTVTVGQPAAAVDVAATVTNQVLCFGEMTGSINAVGSGGTAPYSYTWSNGKTDQTNMPLAAGTYTVTVTDANGCTDTDMATVTQPASAVEVEISASMGPACAGGSDGTATASGSGGTGSITYEWSTGATTAMISGLTAGNYTVTATDENGCTAVASVLLSQPSDLDVEITGITHVNCNGGMTGSLTATATGGQGAVSYSWSNGGMTATISNLEAGIYTVTASQPGGCTAVATAEVTEPTALVAEIISQTNETCDGNEDGTATVNATGGTTPYTYLWSDGQTTATATGLGAGTYSVVVTDDNSCSVTINDIEIESDGTLDLEDPANLVVCPDANVADILLSAVPSDPATSYSWSGGAGAGLANGSTSGLNPAIPGFTAGANEGTWTVTVTATLGACSDTESFTIQIVDNTAPVLMGCPGNLVLNNDVDKCSAVATWSDPTASDDCGAATVTKLSGPNSGVTVNVGSPVTITYQAEDESGNTATCSFTVTVMDMQAPEAICEDITIELDANGEASIMVGDVDGGSTDNCGVTSTSINQDMFDCDDIGDVTIVLTVEDAASNAQICYATVTVEDNEVPTIECPADVNQNNDPDDCSAEINYPDVTIDDNCIVNLQNQAEQVTFNFTGNVQTWEVPSGVTEIQIEAWGAQGGSYSTNGPGGQGGFASGTLPVTPGEILEIYVGGQGSWTDAMDENAPGGFNGGGNGGFDAANQVVNGGSGGGASDVRQGGSGLADRVIVAAGGGGGSVARVGGEGGGLTGGVGMDFTNSIPGGGGTQLMGGQAGLLTRGATHGTLGQGGQGGTNVQAWGCGGGGGGYYGGGGGTSTTDHGSGYGAPGGGGSSYIDGVSNGSTMSGVQTGDGLVTISYNTVGNVVQIAGLPSGSDFPVGSTVNTFMITDAAGNTATCSFTVNITDNQDPAITCPANITMNVNAGECYGQYEWDHPEPSDNCGVMFYTAVYTNPDNSQDGPFDLLQVGSSQDPSVTRNFEVGTTTVTYYVDDVNGNTTTCTFTVTVTDNEDPVFTDCPSDVTVTVDVGECSSVQTWSDPVADDNCDVTVSHTSGPLSGTALPVGDNTILYTATDPAGNTATCEWTITVNDTQDPTAVCQDITIYLDANGEATIDADDVDGGSFDDCGIDTRVLSQTEFDCDDVGDVQVTMTVTDLSDNSEVCVAEVTVVDDIDPTIECPTDINVDNDPGECGAEITYNDPTTDDNCDLFPGLVVEEFNFTGSEQQYVVPSGVTEITVELYGAQGAEPNDRLDNSDGGLGGYVTGVLSVTPGETLYLYVGGEGGTDGTGGYNGGGNGGFGSAGSSCSGGDAGGGGGASDIRQGGNALSDRTVVAGGGGGSARDYCNGTCQPCGCGGGGGGAGGMTGEDGIAAYNCGFGYAGQGVNFGGGATQAIGGTAGPQDGGGGNVGTAGTLGQGGNGSDGQYDVAGGGGGGGYYGGGGGGGADNGSGVAGGGGGGGSSYLGAMTMSSSLTGVRSGNGMIRLTINSEGSLVQTAGMPSGSVFPIGTTTNNFILTDKSGNTAECSFNVTVNDVEDPVIACPANITINTSNLGTTGDCQGQYEWTPPTPTDNCELEIYHVVYVNPDMTNSGPQDVYQWGLPNFPLGLAPNNRQFDVGTTTITYYVEDEHGNTTTCSFTVTVNDDENPEFLACPPDITVALDAGKCTSVQTWDQPEAEDNCEVTVTQTVGDPSGTPLAVGVHTINYEAEDNAGNTALCSWSITVMDMQDPVITLEAMNMTVECDEANNQDQLDDWLDDNAGAEADDNCPDDLVWEYELIEEIQGCGSTKTYTYRFRVKDESDNYSAWTTATFTIEDTTDPSLTIPADITIECDESTDPSNTGMAAGSDDCGELPAANVLWINEFHYDNVGTDQNEFIEIAGTAGTDLTGYRLILYNGANGLMYSTINTLGTIDNESNNYGALFFGATDMQNGAPDGVALVRNSDDFVLEFISYEGTFTANDGPAAGMSSVDVGVSEGGAHSVGNLPPENRNR